LPVPARPPKRYHFRPLKILKASFFFLFFALFHPASLPAQEVTLPAWLITSDSGMATEWVNAIFQDRLGFMWFGSNLGVARHDGIHYQVFRRANTLPDPLSNDYILAMAQDDAGDLWLGTRKGLNRFHYASETFSVLLHDPRDPGSLNGNVIMDVARWSSRPGFLWVATADGGLGLLDLKTGRCKSYLGATSRPGAPGSGDVRRVFEDSRKRIWVATAGGLQRFVPETESFEAFRHDAQRADTISDDDVKTIFESPGRPGILWVGTGGNCLNRFDSQRRSWQRFTLPVAATPNPLGNGVGFISDYPADPELLLVGSWQGLYLFHTGRNSWQRVILRDQFRQTGDRNDEFVKGVFRDRSGVCWISIAGRGILKFIPQPAFFRSHVNSGTVGDPASRNDFLSMAEDPDGRLWLGTYGAGLFRFSPGADSFEHFDLGPAMGLGTDFAFVTTLCATPHGELWAATLGGLVRLVPRSGDQEVFPARAGDPAALGFNRVASILEDSQDDVWIGSDFCLLRWDRPTRTFKRYLHDPGDPGSLSGSHVNPILEDRAGNVWVGTENGLNLYDRSRDRFTRYFLDPPDPSKETQNYVMILCEDRHGRLWVGTSNGLNLLERTEAGVRFQHYSSPGSTLRNFILGIVEDDAENLWIGSAGGLSRFDMRTGTFSLYDSRDGVPPYKFNYGSCLRSRSGEFYFGEAGDMVSFKPWLARFNRYVPPLAFTAIQVWRRPLPIGGGSPLSRSITLAPDLVLPYDQNSLAVSFAALSYIRPDNNQYAYRLDGRDGAWREIGFEHAVTLDNLKPGSYRLRVRGSNNEGIWNLAGISLALRIRPPFWQTGWFRALLALAFGVMFVLWNRSRSRRLAERIRTEAAMEHHLDKCHVSPREREIIQLLLKGKSNKEIEDALFISMGTVKNHVYNIFQKLGVKNRGQLAALFKNLRVK
jgi:ligand-binding sensor domain-containing protein/DNA-binding CsgD family transcriptional regulator